MRKAFIFLFIIACLLVNSPCFAQAANWCGSGTSAGNDPLNPSNFSAGSPTGTTPSIWVTDSLSKYIQTASNTVTSNKGAYPCAAKNEFADFQIHIKNTSGSSETLNSVTMSSLVNSVTGTTISASSSNIIVYAERYYNVQALSDANGIGIGPTPDPLVPTVEPYHGQTTNAFPITIPSGGTQSIWVDILVPTTAPSGYYSGTATITISGSTYATLPVVLAVWNFTIPSRPTLKNYFGGGGLEACDAYYGGYSGCGAYPGSGGSPDLAITLTDLDLGYLLMDHRISPGGILYPPYASPPNNWTTFDANYGPLFTGTSTHTILPGAQMNIFFFSQGSNANAADWITHFTSKSPSWLPQLASYDCDEPGSSSSAWKNCATEAAYGDSTSPNVIGNWITASIANATANYAGSNPTPLQYLNYLIVQEYDMYYMGSNRSSYNSWLAGGSGSFSTQGVGPNVGMYESCSNHGSCSNGTEGSSAFTYPSNMIDATSIRNRAMPWAIYYESASAEEYYDTGNCWWQSCGNGAGGSGSNAWSYIYAFGGNGDGTLVYPSMVNSVSQVGSGVTTPIPIGSIRLKHERDGQQDYEYMHLLVQKGQSAFVTTELSSWFTNDGSFSNSVGIGCTGCLMSARNAMGNELHQLAAATAPAPPTNLTATVQ